jgi:hypothetical protein
LRPIVPTVQFCERGEVPGLRGVLPTLPAGVTTLEVLHWLVTTSVELADAQGRAHPVAELLKRASARALDQLGTADARRVQARAADADLGVVAQDVLEHGFEVVVAVRHFLPALGAGGGVADQKHLDRFAIAVRQAAGQAQGVIARSVPFAGSLRINFRGNVARPSLV